MRPGWDEYFMEIARTVATRATCPRASVGAVLVRDHRILTTGYNGAPRHVAHCTEVGCDTGQRPLPALDARRGQRHRSGRAARRRPGGCHGVLHAPALRQLRQTLDQRGRRADRLRPSLSRRVRSTLLAEAGVALVAFASLEGARAGSQRVTATRLDRHAALRASPPRYLAAGNAARAPSGHQDRHVDAGRRAPHARRAEAAHRRLRRLLRLRVRALRDARLRARTAPQFHHDADDIHGFLGLLFGSTLISASGSGTT